MMVNGSSEHKFQLMKPGYVCTIDTHGWSKSGNLTLYFTWA